MKKVIIICAMLFLSARVLAQEVINNQSLIEMKKAGLSDDIIRTKIATEESRFDTSTNAILELKNNGFSDETISVMIKRNSALYDSTKFLLFSPIIIGLIVLLLFLLEKYR